MIRLSGTRVPLSEIKQRVFIIMVGRNYGGGKRYYGVVKGYYGGGKGVLWVW